MNPDGRYGYVLVPFEWIGKHVRVVCMEHYDHNGTQIVREYNKEVEEP